MLILCVVDEGSRPMGRVCARMRLGTGAIEDTVPWVFISRQSYVVLMSLLALGSSVGMGINTSGIDLNGHPSTAFETTLAPVCHLCIDVALSPVSLSLAPALVRSLSLSLSTSLSFFLKSASNH